MGDHWNRNSRDERMGGSEADDRVRGRAKDEDEFDEFTEDQDEEDVDEEGPDVDIDDGSSF
jgi:hypothetical protein